MFRWRWLGSFKDVLVVNIAVWISFVQMTSIEWKVYLMGCIPFLESTMGKTRFLDVLQSIRDCFSISDGLHHSVDVDLKITFFFCHVGYQSLYRSNYFALQLLPTTQRARYTHNTTSILVSKPLKTVWRSSWESEGLSQPHCTI